MTSLQRASTAQPAATPASLRAQIDALQASINDANARRAVIQAKIDASPSRGERVVLRNTEMRVVDGELGRLNAQIARLRSDLRQAEAIAANPPPAQPAIAPPAPTPAVVRDVAPVATTTVPPASGMNINSLMLGGAAAVLVFAPLFFMLVWRAGRRAALAALRAESMDDGSRLARMEEAIASVSLEVERVSESQRFLTNALVGNSAKAPSKEKVSTQG